MLVISTMAAALDRRSRLRPDGDDEAVAVWGYDMLCLTPLAALGPTLWSLPDGRNCARTGP